MPLCFNQLPGPIQMEIFIIQRLLGHLISFSDSFPDKDTAFCFPRRLQSAKLFDGTVRSDGDARNFRAARGNILFDLTETLSLNFELMPEMFPI